MFLKQTSVFKRAEKIVDKESFGRKNKNSLLVLKIKSSMLKF